MIAKGRWKACHMRKMRFVASSTRICWASAISRRASDVVRCSAEGSTRGPGRFRSSRTSRRTARRRSYGDEVADVADAMGHPFLPWHAEVAYPALEYRVKTGRFYYDEAVVATVPRQNGKTRGLSWPLMAWWGAKWPDQYVVYTAENRLKAARRLCS